MPVDLLSEVPPSGGFEKMITGKDKISRYAFASRYPILQPSTKQYYNKKCASTYINNNRQSLSFLLKCDTRNSCSPKYSTSSCNHEVWPNNRRLKMIACQDKDVIEKNVLMGIPQTMAQIFNTSLCIIHYNVSHWSYGDRTKRPAK